MKMINCHIENFGTLSQYNLAFSEGLTVIKEPNGFGKSTLAAFIRTMFYGMPRSSKNILKSDRTRFMPWQGGKYGGSLTFESNGKQYRIERFFGDTPGKDTFSILDLKTKRESLQFTNNIGQELFELDSDSFERSTFMPQLYQETSLNTSSIQAKLSDLVEDTNDVNNFDKAVSALRAKRTTLRQFRGTAGSIDNAQANITRLNSELEQIGKQKKLLTELIREHAGQTLLMEQKRIDLRIVRSRITKASEMEALTSHVRELRELKKSQEKLTHQLKTLRSKYPQGLPTMDVIEELEVYSREFDALSASEVDTHTIKDISEVVKRFEKKFESGLPSDGSLIEYQDKYRDYVATNTVLSQIGLNEAERKELTSLEQLFSAGIPTEDELRKRKEASNRLDQLRAQQKYQVLSSSEIKEKEHLEQFFLNGIPEEETLRQQQTSYLKASELRQYNAELIGNVQTFTGVEEPTENKKLTKSTAIFIGGAVSLVIGAVLLAMQLNLPGAVVLAFGVILLAVALYHSMTTAVKREVSSQVIIPRLSPEAKIQIQTNEQTISELDSQVGSFISQYSIEGQTINQALSTIQAKRENLISLQAKSDELEKLRNDINDQCSVLEKELNEFLVPFFGELSQNYSELDELSDKRKTLLRLRKQENEQNERKQILIKQAIEYEKEIITFLKPYYPEPIDPDQFGSLLPDLGRDTTAYTQATQNLLKINEAELIRNSRKEALFAQISEILNKLGINSPPPFSNIVRNLRDAVLEEEKIVPAYNENKNAVDRFLEVHGDLTHAQLPDTEFDLDGLKTEENKIIREIDRLSKENLNREQIIDKTKANIDLLPTIEDDLDRWSQLRDRDEQNCSLLDVTIEMLKDAKDSLSDNYINEIEGSFTRYANDLLAGELGEILLSPNLDIQLERYGEARNLAFFSVGYANAIMLCMRLALIDALYKKETPMIILDDPFVNLDDEHTDKALLLLRKLAESKQILYLVCNSSRC